MGGILPKGSYPYIKSTPKKVFLIFGRKWGAHFYLASPNYNKIIDNFQNRPPLLVMNCWQCEDKLYVGLEKIIYECSFALIFDNHWHMLFLTYWLTNRKWRSVLLPKLIYYYPVISNAYLYQNWKTNLI